MRKTDENYAGVLRLENAGEAIDPLLLRRFDVEIEQNGERIQRNHFL